VLTETDEEKKNAWLYLMHATRKILLKHLDALGISAVERM
jgi:arginyl-tRNA synthetase